MKLAAATKNINKIKEIREKFTGLKEIEILSLTDFENPPDIIEDGTTFEENALKKAREIFEFTKLAVLADDSGLEIDALDGEPGIYSARYGGEYTNDEDKNRLILERMKNIPEDKRSARFVCVIAIILPDKTEYAVKGVCEGIISYEMKGGNGFGYDPIFYLPQYRKTMAELSLSEKNRISHRALALEKAEDILRKITACVS